MGRTIAALCCAATLTVSTLAGVSTTTADAAPTATASVTRAATTPPAVIVRDVTYAGRTLRVRLHPVATRGPAFRVLVQRDDGTLVRKGAPPQRSYLGSVVGVPSAVAAGILRSDGAFEGVVVFDRGGTWQFVDDTVVSTRGLTQPTSYHWPSADDATRNVTVAPGQVGSRTYRWEIGYDLANRWFTDPGTIDGSIARALDAVELNTVILLAAYEVDARLRPATGRVIIRASATAEPYAGYTDLLGKVKTEWDTHQADAAVDSTALWDGGAGGGGVAYVNVISSSWAVSDNGGTGTPWVVDRHEIGHNWGAHDNHTNGPEGATINSGNQYHRFDGTELSAILRLRDDRLAWDPTPLPVVKTLAEPVPPYAALDLYDAQVSGIARTFRPTRNDSDANGGALSLRSIRLRSHLGGHVTRDGNVITYLPPTVGAPTTDWVTYVVADASGKTATGVALFHVGPAS